MNDTQPDFRSSIAIGCAGWSIPKVHRESFPEEGSHLERYARVFNAVEINSSFYRPHRLQTYEKWAAIVPQDFTFAVKVPKQITHERKLVDTNEIMETFLSQVNGLGGKLGALLVQLPPSLAFHSTTSGNFFTHLRSRHSGAIVCEPRHRTWFSQSARAILQHFAVAQVAADPSLHETLLEPSGDLSLVYYRLHGSPQMYYSAYDLDMLQELSSELREHQSLGRKVWCIFDNTAAFHATANALQLGGMLGLHHCNKPFMDFSHNTMAGSNNSSGSPASGP